MNLIDSRRSGSKVKSLGSGVDWSWYGLLRVLGAYGECAKPVNQALLVQRLTVGLEPPGDNCCSESVSETRRLVVVVDPPGDHCKHRILKGLDAWQYASPTRRSGDLRHLAPCALCQAIPWSKGVLLTLMCVVYNAPMMPQRSTFWCSLSCGSR